MGGTGGGRLRLAHLYPDIMDVYGDRGNAIALRYRCEARGIGLDVDGVGIGDAFDPRAYDLLIIGGGEDREQRRIAADLAAKGPAIRAAVEEGLPALAVCGGFQLFGERYVDADGDVLPGIGIFRMETRHPGEGAERATGNVLLRTAFGEVVGFENHGGRTWLDERQERFGTVVAGAATTARTAPRARAWPTQSAPTCTAACCRGTPPSPTSCWARRSHDATAARLRWRRSTTAPRKRPATRHGRSRGGATARGSGGGCGGCCGAGAETTGGGLALLLQEC